MAKPDTTDLLTFLTAFPAEVQERVLWLRDFVWDRYPQANELIYDNYNAFTFGWSPTEKVSHTFCNIAVFRTNLNVILGFYWGAELPDPEKKLIGNGSQFRYMSVPAIGDFPTAYAERLILDAWLNSLKKVKNQKEIVSGKTILKSVSAAKRTKKAKA